MSHDAASEAPGPTVGELAQLACIAEVLAPKAGNVHPGADFADATWADFVVSTVVCRPLLDVAAQRGVGRTVLDCVHATRDAVGSNTNLGMILLLAPLCAIPLSQPLRTGATHVLAGLTMDDAEHVYEAIRVAAPGGLGTADAGDVNEAPTMRLTEAMRLAAPRDRVALQYAGGFADLFDAIAPRLIALIAGGLTIDQAIVRLHLELIAQGDSLIARKAGDEIATEAARRARTVCEEDWPRSAMAAVKFAELDTWLRADGRRRNPGTSADLVAAALFVALREGDIAPPMKWAAPISSSPCV